MAVACEDVNARMQQRQGGVQEQTGIWCIIMKIMGNTGTRVSKDISLGFIQDDERKRRGLSKGLPVNSRTLFPAACGMIWGYVGCYAVGLRKVKDTLVKQMKEEHGQPNANLDCG